jgi:hypothetical protein
MTEQADAFLTAWTTAEQAAASAGQARYLRTGPLTSRQSYPTRTGSSDGVGRDS